MSSLFKKILIFFACLTCNFHATADSEWRDPSWNEMLDSSELITLVEYISDGTFKAHARILKIYKGKAIIGDSIQVTGFSDYHGPKDKITTGDRYILFLHSYFFKEKLSNETKKGYFVWSPTSGDLKVIDETIQYDLVETSFNPKEKYFSLQEFEIFLSNYISKKDNTQFCKDLILKLNPVNEDDQSSQYLLMLSLFGYTFFEDIFNDYANAKNPTLRYAIGRLMGNINNERSINILTKLLEDEQSYIQCESVRQLKHWPVEIIGPILTQHLITDNKLKYGPFNFMNGKRMNRTLREVIKTLGNLKYKPAIPYLLPLLNTDNEYVFTSVIHCIERINGTDYLAYLRKHLGREQKVWLKEYMPHSTKNILNPDPANSKFKVFDINNKWLYADTSNLKVLYPKFDYIGDFHYSIARVKKNGKWGYIDTSGKIITPVVYAWAEDFHEGFGIITQGNGKRENIGIVNIFGIVKWTEYSYAENFTNGFAKFYSHPWWKLKWDSTIDWKQVNINSFNY